MGVSSTWQKQAARRSADPAPVGKRRAVSVTAGRGTAPARAQQKPLSKQKTLPTRSRGEAQKAQPEPAAARPSGSAKTVPSEPVVQEAPKRAPRAAKPAAKEDKEDKSKSASTQSAPTKAASSTKSRAREKPPPAKRPAKSTSQPVASNSRVRKTTEKAPVSHTMVASGRVAKRTPTKKPVQKRSTAPAKRKAVEGFAEIVDSIPPTNVEVQLGALPSVNLAGGERVEEGVEVDDELSDWEDDGNEKYRHVEVEEGVEVDDELSDWEDDDNEKYLHVEVEEGVEVDDELSDWEVEKLAVQKTVAEPVESKFPSPSPSPLARSPSPEREPAVESASSDPVAENASAAPVIETTAETTVEATLGGETASQVETASLIEIALELIDTLTPTDAPPADVASPPMVNPSPPLRQYAYSPSPSLHDSPSPALGGALSPSPLHVNPSPPLEGSLSLPMGDVDSPLESALMGDTPLTASMGEVRPLSPPAPRKRIAQPTIISLGGVYPTQTVL